MPKQLIVLCDGTTNSPEADRGRENNVQVLRNILSIGAKRNIATDRRQDWEIDHYAVDGIERYTYYDRGLGSPQLDSNGKLQRWSWLPHSFFKNSQYIYSKFREVDEQITARGIIDNVAQAYKFLAQNYVPGDKIFLFGFSRGAYTLRLLESMIRYIGLINKNKYVNEDALDAAIEYGFSLYDMNVHPNNNAAAVEFRKNCFPHEGIIHFLGLWDTVRGMVKEKVHNDAKISGAVNISRHALAIDEQRHIFKPEVWVAKPDANSQQVWFAGAHSDIGGGYKDRGLANITLHWMVTEAINSGLMLDAKILQADEFKPDPLAMQTDSLHGKLPDLFKSDWEKLGGIYRRPVALMTASERLHETVFVRYGDVVKRDAVAMLYHPSNLTHTLVAYKSSLKNNSAAFTQAVSTLKIPEADTLSDVGEDTSLIRSRKVYKA